MVGTRLDQGCAGAIVKSAHEPPRVQFDFVTTTRGLDYVNEIRYDAAS
jgi:hypothetical protein